MIRPHYFFGCLVLLALLTACVVTWLGNPVHRDDLAPIDTNFRINVNTADADTLSLLSGISTKTGGYIIDRREKNGPFKTPADLDAVHRLGPITIQKITPYISFE